MTNFAAWPEPVLQPDEPPHSTFWQRIFASEYDDAIKTGREQIIATLIGNRETFAGYVSNGRSHAYTAMELHDDLINVLPEDFGALVLGALLAQNQIALDMLRDALEKRLSEFLAHHAELKADAEATAGVTQ